MNIEQPPKPSRPASLPILLIIGAGIALAFNWKGFIHALDHGHDSLLYVRLALSITQGQWLGEYNHMTLIRQPVYSVFLALSSFMEFRLHIVQYALTVAASLLLCAALYQVRISSYSILILFMLLVFHPMIILVTFFAITESLYLPLTIFFLAGATGIIAKFHSSRLSFLLWLSLFGVSFSLLWHTRAESVWLVPGFILLLIALTHINRHHLKLFWPRILIALALPILLSTFLGHLIKAQNYKHYGIKITHELSEKNFESAFKQLVRVSPEYHQPYIPVSRKAMEDAFAASPSFAQLSDFMSAQFDGQGWSQAGYQWMGIDEELVNGWFMWAVRDGAYLLGKHQNPVAASEYYGRIADEIAYACQEQALSCSSPRTTGNMLAPPITFMDSLRVLPSTVKILWMIINFGEFSDGGPAFDPSAHTTDYPAEIFSLITHDQKNQKPLFDSKYRFLHYSMFKVIHLVIALLIFASLIIFVMDRSADKNAVCRYYICFFCLVMIISRTALAIYLDAFSFHAQIRYLFPVYPFFLAYIFVFPWNRALTQSSPQITTGEKLANLLYRR